MSNRNIILSTMISHTLGPRSYAVVKREREERISFYIHLFALLSFPMFRSEYVRNDSSLSFENWDQKGKVFVCLCVCVYVWVFPDYFFLFWFSSSYYLSHLLSLRKFHNSGPSRCSIDPWFILEYKILIKNLDSWFFLMVVEEFSEEKKNLNYPHHWNISMHRFIFYKRNLIESNFVEFYFVIFFLWANFNRNSTIFSTEYI